MSGKQIRGSLQKVPINHEEYEKYENENDRKWLFFFTKYG